MTLLLAGLLVSLAGCQAPETSKSGLDTPNAHAARLLYGQAWETVAEEYVDSGFNGQDWADWKHRFDGKLRDPADAYVAIATMLASLNDEYTRFLTPRNMREQTMNIDSRLSGIGVQISTLAGNKLVVVAPIEGTPAALAGLQPKDVILKINGEGTAGMTVQQAADRIRGPEGSRVTLTLQRGTREFDQAIVRADIKLKSVFTKLLADGRIGYIRLSSFISESMSDELARALDQLDDKQALVLDLRGNYGGLFSNAVEAADMFLDHGAIVLIVNRAHDTRAYAAQPGTLFNKPMVVLIDGASASASEILSGALKDQHRATLIGSQTFGKGLVQKINLLDDGAGLNITVSKYLTPNGTDINKKGIAPDITVPMTAADFMAQRDPVLDRAVRYLKTQTRVAVGAHGGR